MDLVSDHGSSVLFGEGARGEESRFLRDPAGWVVVGGDVGFGVADRDGLGVAQEEGKASGGVAAAPAGGVCPVGDGGWPVWLNVQFAAAYQLPRWAARGRRRPVWGRRFPSRVPTGRRRPGRWLGSRFLATSRSGGLDRPEFPGGCDFWEG